MLIHSNWHRDLEAVVGVVQLAITNDTQVLIETYAEFVSGKPRILTQ